MSIQSSQSPNASDVPDLPNTSLPNPSIEPNSIPHLSPISLNPLSSLPNPSTLSSVLTSLNKTNPLTNSFTQACSVKLDRTNYLLWQSLMLPIIRGNKLEGFILGTHPCPQKYLEDGGAPQLNPQYEEWVSTDQLLLGWMLNTMTIEIAAQMGSCSTSQELWNAAKELTGAHIRSRVTLYKSELQQMRKGGLKMEDYLSKMKQLSDNLLLAGCPVSMNDLVTTILAGLDSEYTPIVVQLNDKENISWIELQTALLTYEARLEQLNHFSNLSLGSPNAFVNVARTENRNFISESSRGN